MNWPDFCVWKINKRRRMTIRASKWFVLLLPIVSLAGCGLYPLGEVQHDYDADGVLDSTDKCENTALGAVVDANGCSAEQLDSDSDGVNDALDECVQTPVGVDVDDRGCLVDEPSVTDDDDDGVPNNIDQCANTVVEANVDSNGCADSQLDTDGDGVTDDLDECPATPPQTAVLANGCPDAPTPLPVCGNGAVEGTETCDDGNAIDTDDCRNNCTRCGDGHLDAGEQCDDGNTNTGDGCSNYCQIEYYSPLPPPPPPPPPPACGDGVIDIGEECDDGNNSDGDGCSSICQNEPPPPPPPAGPAPVVLGTAGDFVILAKAGIDTVPTSVVTGDIGVSPIDSTAITGFSLVLDAGTTFSTSDQVTGKVFASDYSPPTPDNMTTAVSDMEAAYTDAAGRPIPDFTELGAGDIGGLTLVPGLYKWGTGVLISTDVTLSGGPEDTWIFQIAGGITQASDTSVLLIGGALPENIFWQVADVVALDTGAHFEGIILAATNITLATGASINGRLLAQTAVTIDQSVVTQP